VQNKNLRDLVKRARGDRTKKKFAEDSGVNVAIISRIESGDYFPGKNVLARLTSVSAKPQGDVSYDDLVEAAKYSKQYHKGIATGMIASIASIGGMGIPLLAALFSNGMMIKGQELLAEKNEGVTNNASTKKEDNLSLLEIENMATQMERYKATAMGVILAKLAENGIGCRLGKQENTDFPMNYTDMLFLVEDNDIDVWLLSCFTMNEGNRNMEALIKPFAVRFIEKLLHTKPDPKKKASFVVDSDDLYEYLLELKEHNSYRGNLSIIQFDAPNVRLIREDYIAHYDLEYLEDKLLVVSENTEK